MALNKVVSSGILSSSGVVSNTPCGLAGISCFTDGTNAGTLTIYDNASAASGTVLAKLSVPGANLGAQIMFPANIKAVNGVYASLAGTGATAIVLTEP